MRAVIQRVSEASVRVGAETIGRISAGLLVLLCVEKGDTGNDVRYVVDKITRLRCFGDDAGKMNLSVMDVRGSLLVISQFTLAATLERGRRPSFDNAEAPDRAEALYEEFVSQARASGVPVETGRFAAMMDVSLVNQGPVTFFLQTRGG